MNDSVVGTIIVAVMSLAGTIGGSYMGVRQSNKLVNFRIDKLEEKVDRHNQLVERMALVERDVKAAHKRIDNLRDRKIDDE